MDVWSLDSCGILENDKENVLMNPTKVVFSVFFSPSRASGGIHSLQIRKIPRCFGWF